MNRRTIIRCIVLPVSGACFLLGIQNGAADSQEPEPWHNAHLFTKPLDQAVKFGEPINPLKPPRLSVSFLIGDSVELTASADYINLGTKRVRLHGRMIKDRTGGARRFYPYARLEVSDQSDRGWEVIGRSPSATSGVPRIAVMVPVKLGVANPQAKTNESCMIDMNPFRKYVGKFRYGRIVLKDGGTSQVLGLNELLPPKDAFR
jgi:hypothetical protein